MKNSNKPSSQFSIRAFRAQDASKVRNLVKSVLEEFGFRLDCSGDDSDIEDAGHYYSPPSSVLLILEFDGTLAGTAGVKRSSSEKAELRRMYLKPDMRGRGFGKALLTSALDFAKSRGYDMIYLQTSERFERAIELYKSFGFHLTGKCNSRCELTYEKSLKDWSS